MSNRAQRDRRTHLRVSSADLPELPRVRIPEKPPVTLVDLSTGGALLEASFQLALQQRVFLDMEAGGQQVRVPFQLVRCGVKEVTDAGVRYHVAGAFEQVVTLPRFLSKVLAPVASVRALAAVEGFLRGTQLAGDLEARGVGLADLLAWVLRMLRSGESPEAVAASVTSHLSQRFPKLLVLPAGIRPPDVSSAASARFFGYDFRWVRPFSAADRRFLRAVAQLLTLLADATKDTGAARTAPLVPPADTRVIVHSLAEW